MANLTMKQETFCQKLEEGMTQLEAYKFAYNAENMTDKSIWEKACVLANRVKIVERREELRAPVLKKIGYTIEKHLEELYSLAEKAAEAGQFAPAMQAITNRGKCSGFYIEKVDHTTNGESISPTRIEIVAPKMDVEK